LARRHDGRLKVDNRSSAQVAEVRIDGKRVVLAVPTTYMNESGQAAGALMRRYGIDDPRRLVVVHDELDLDPGRLKLKDGGGLAGHNGLRSLDAHLHTPDFLRIRLGVGKPPGGPERGADWVLSRVPKRERTELDVMVAEAADAVEMILSDGLDAAMARFNQRP
jgi:PTH1 family peptidyl-tRNA hydrolase